MKWTFPPGWARNLPDSNEEHVFAGTPSTAEDILAELLLHERTAPELRKYTKEMIRFGWFAKDDGQTESGLMQTLVTLLHGYPQSSPALLRGSLEPTEAKEQADPRLLAWLAHLNWLSLKDTFETPYEIGRLTVDSLRDIARLSVHNDGPLRAVQYLRGLGISVHVCQAIHGTRVDGCAFWSLAKRPLIGLSLRFDRLDNFWFSLLHECAHVALHVKGPNQAFADDVYKRNETDELEIEANLVAADAAIPRALWKRSDASKWPTPSNIERLAQQAGIHPSIIAGRARFERGDYTLLGKMVGQGQVSKLFGIKAPVQGR